MKSCQSCGVLVAPTREDDTMFCWWCDAPAGQMQDDPFAWISDDDGGCDIGTLALDPRLHARCDERGK